MGYPEQAIDLFRGQEPMTIVCAVKVGQNLFLATDSAVGELQLKTTTDKKIAHVDNPPLVWATAVDEAIGDMFGAWLRQYLAATPPQPLTWEKVVGDSVSRLAGLNGNRVLAGQLNRITTVPERDLCEVLLVGYVAGMPEIVHLEVSGAWTMHVAAGRTFASIGGGAPYAAMAYEVLKEKDLLPADGADAIGEVAGLAAKHAPKCEPPVHIWRATPEGVEEVDGQEA